MKTTNNYIDSVQALYPKVKNDSQLAALLGIKRQTISQYRHGQSMSVIMAVRVADILGLHPMETISATMYEQCRSCEERAYWQQQFTRYAA